MSVPDGNHFLLSMRPLAPGLVPGPAGRHDLAVDRERIASWWDDHGEKHPLDDEGLDLMLELQPFADSARCSPDWQWITLHHQGYDWKKTVQPRSSRFSCSMRRGSCWTQCGWARRMAASISRFCWICLGLCVSAASSIVVPANFLTETDPYMRRKALGFIWDKELLYTKFNKCRELVKSWR